VTTSDREKFLTTAPRGTVREMRRPIYLPKEAWEASMLNVEHQEEHLSDDELPTYGQRWAMVYGYALGWHHRGLEEEMK